MNHKVLDHYTDQDAAYLIVAVPDTSLVDGKPQPKGTTVQHIVRTPSLDQNGHVKTDEQVDADLRRALDAKLAEITAPRTQRRQWNG